jgi:hypothetical protein
MPGPTRRELFAHSGAALAASRSGFAVAAAGRERRVLSGRYGIEKVAAVLLPREKWHPFPTAAEREGWNPLAEEARTALIADGESGLKGDWSPLPATLFLEFARNGNRSNYEHVRNLRRARLHELVIAECVEGKGRFVAEIVNGLWTTLEESYWGVPAHLGMQKAGPGLPDVAEPTVDLFAAETGALIAWIDYLLGPALDAVSPLIRERIHREVDRRILTPNLEREFGWMGFDGGRVNNWNPWINSNWLTAALLLERDEQRRRATVARSLRSLDYFLDSYHDDGGCDEGPSYWSVAGGALFDCLELLRSATAGSVDVYDVPLVKEIGRYIYRVHINDNYFINFADAPASLRLSADLVYRYGRRIGDEKMSALGAWAGGGNDRSYRDEGMGRQLPALFGLAELRSAPRSQALVRDTWFPGIQVIAARVEEGSARGLYLAAKGGHNAESHNHNDVGNFIVYANGEPFLIDVGVETYTAKTFSPQRYDIWTMQSAYHNLPTIDGVMQKDGRRFAASDVRYRSDGGAAELSLNIAGAYPPEAGLELWKRTLRLDRAKNQIDVRDEYKLRKRASQITLTLMTPCAVSEGAPGELLLTGAASKLKMLFDARALKASTEEIPVRDAHLKGVWGDRLYRILLRADAPPAEAAWAVRISM